MSDAHNGPHIPPKATDLIGAVWVKSTRSGPTGGNCVEVAFLPQGDVALRNSRHPDGSALIFTRAEWDAFIGGARDGEFGSPARSPF
jgi:Domain of unknown function (DUF397)